MATTQHRAKRKSTGGRYKAARSKRKFEIGRLAILTKLGLQKTKTVKTKGGNSKSKLASGETINLVGKDNKIVKAKILNVIENKANRHFVRRNIITKGTVVETDKGQAKVTSRPGQEAVLNGVLV
ncbi:30S ribosomal protein S8e [Candidatus Woesearchaeota archaeon]|jgi:small subunit ribosomal protein S8e|nr:30S ribosomal protein S8e [Candidatus Woesearchaeota archaeon]MBT3536964.1 30S ribosomal protein S8e [Candidatus Woesearchaeota archaeon]MBT4697574.1 30S ribosomal protein S8e [Candidatus Woesearchaeota archaeon]MBT4717688.1 30S ribosomal protein S8e [Candidatus Woesearchaeota archaeon]MBT7106726.1 30S ribosomal protein S8e [Candidatus Woesearchaeota archaeon]